MQPQQAPRPLPLLFLLFLLSLSPLILSDSYIQLLRSTLLSLSLSFFSILSPRHHSLLSLTNQQPSRDSRRATVPCVDGRARVPCTNGTTGAECSCIRIRKTSLGYSKLQYSKWCVSSSHYNHGGRKAIKEGMKAIKE